MLNFVFMLCHVGRSFV